MLLKILKRYISKCNANDLMDIAGILVDVGADLKETITIADLEARPILARNVEGSGPRDNGGGVGLRQIDVSETDIRTVPFGLPDGPGSDSGHETAVAGHDDVSGSADPGTVPSNG
jgi:hypothetical protein